MKILIILSLIYLLYSITRWMLKPKVDFDITISVKKKGESEHVEVKFKDTQAATFFLEQVEKEDVAIEEYTLSFIRKK